MTKQENKDGWDNIEKYIPENEWVLIEDEKDYPLNNTDCWFICNNVIYLGYYSTRGDGYFVNMGDDIERKYISHYQPIQKPKPPIY